MLEWLSWLLVAQGVIGGSDTLINHELFERLPERPVAHGEIGMHSMREAIYGTLFIGLAWWDWNGGFALVIAALLAAELAVTTTDEIIENRIRVLPTNERVLHVLLTVNYGLIVALLVPILVTWGAKPAGLAPRDLGGFSWLVTALGLASWAWSVRDAFAWRRLHRQFVVLQAPAR